MIPSKRELEESIGESIPDSARIEFATSFPTPEEQAKENLVFKFASIIYDKYKVFLASKFGQIVGVYLFLISFGFEFPTPVKMAQTSWDEFANISASVYAYVNTPSEKPKGYLIVLPTEYLDFAHTEQTNFHDLPIGTGIFPVSGEYLG